MTLPTEPNLTRADFLALVDHTLLKPEATGQQIAELCDEALGLKPKAVCVNGYWAATVTERLASSGVLSCAVVGFPLGSMNPNALAAETGQAVDDGVAEMDMVLPVGLFRTDRAAAGRVIEAVRASAGEGVTLKVILETAILNDDEIVAACQLSVESGADFVKTSTGFNPAGGATTHAVALMRETVGPDIGVKASGGIRNLDDVRSMVAAGANRLGMSATLAVAAEL